MLKTETLIDLAFNSTADSHKVASACYDKRGRVLSTAFNQTRKSHPIQAYYAAKAGQPHKVYLHAETLALIRAKEDVYAIHVLRCGPKGYPKPSLPCCICMGYIVESGVREVYFYNDSGNLEKVEV